jgi:hypothetical protein
LIYSRKSLQKSVPQEVAVIDLVDDLELEDIAQNDKEISAPPMGHLRDVPINPEISVDEEPSRISFPRSPSNTIITYSNVSAKSGPPRPDRLRNYKRQITPKPFQLKTDPYYARMRKEKPAHN